MVKPLRPPVVLTIAGLDPSAGAGILGDIKTISAFGCYGIAAVTSVTFQNTLQVFGALDQTGETVRRQIAPLFDDFEVSAIKTGMLPSAEVIREVAALIEAKAVPLVVVDPVLRSTSGFDLIDEGAVDALSGVLFPLATLVTPNVAEAKRITGLDIRDQREMERAAEAILKMGARAALITGGDANGDLSADLLLDAQGAVVYSAKRIRSKHTHGTGCTLASAIACLLARGRSLRESVSIAKQYINAGILSAPGLGHGNGPLNHFPAGFEIEN
ncbi:MAG: bifunctional hydroxymethylpyrimidine kinase/phosphomethylpyrimidine kinase [Acidobacteriota bacterium]